MLLHESLRIQLPKVYRQGSQASRKPGKPGKVREVYLIKEISCTLVAFTLALSIVCQAISLVCRKLLGKVKECQVEMCSKLCPTATCTGTSDKAHPFDLGCKASYKHIYSLVNMLRITELPF